MTKKVVSLLVASCCVAMVGCGRKEAPPAPPAASAKVDVGAAPQTAPAVTAPAAEKAVTPTAATTLGPQAQTEFERLLAQVQKQIDTARYAEALATLRQESNNPSLTAAQRARLRATRDALADRLTRSLAEVKTLVIGPAPRPAATGAKPAPRAKP